MTDEHNPEAEPTNLIAQAKGRAAFLRDRGEVKTPDLLEALAAKLAEAEANQHRLECENTERLRALMAAEAERDQAKKFRDFVLAKGSDAVKRAKAAEAEMSRLRTAQDAMVGAVIEQAAQRCEADVPEWATSGPGTAFAAVEAAVAAEREREAGHLNRAALDVLAERQRQMSAEGWTPAHDDTHDSGQLARAATCYAYEAGWPSAVDLIWGNNRTKHLWPWSRDWWKPRDRRRNAVRAAALLIAEIERLDRAEAAAIRKGVTP